MKMMSAAARIFLMSVPRPASEWFIHSPGFKSKAVAEINITEINILKKANPNRTASE
jgi:hypothetical protein